MTDQKREGPRSPDPLEDTLCICGAQYCSDHAGDHNGGYPEQDPRIEEADAYATTIQESRDVAPSLKGRFDMDLTREQALFIIAAGLSECKLWSLMCYEYGDGDDFVGLCDDDFDTIREDQRYQTFALWLNTPTKED